MNGNTWGDSWGGSWNDSWGLSWNVGASFESIGGGAAAWLRSRRLEDDELMLLVFAEFVAAME